MSKSSDNLSISIKTKAQGARKVPKPSGTVAKGDSAVKTTQAASRDVAPAQDNAIDRKRQSSPPSSDEKPSKSTAVKKSMRKRAGDKAGSAAQRGRVARRNARTSSDARGDEEPRLKIVALTPTDFMQEESVGTVGCSDAHESIWSGISSVHHADDASEEGNSAKDSRESGSIGSVDLFFTLAVCISSVSVPLLVVQAIFPDFSAAIVLTPAALLMIPYCLIMVAVGMRVSASFGSQIWDDACSLARKTKNALVGFASRKGRRNDG